MKIAGYDLPDTCPRKCPNKGSFNYYGQSAICGRCPVFVCTKEDENDFCLVDPEDYRPDWAKVWSDWFTSGMKGCVQLKLTVDNSQLPRPKGQGL